MGEDNFRITNEYSGAHRGLDLASTPKSWVGETLYATDAGRVSAIGEFPSGATYVQLTTNHGVVVQYAHTSPLPGLTLGSPVLPGQGIATINMTGVTNAPHLHLNVLYEGEYVNPRFYLGR